MTPLMGEPPKFLRIICAGLQFNKKQNKIRRKTTLETKKQCAFPLKNVKI